MEQVSHTFAPMLTSPLLCALPLCLSLVACGSAADSPQPEPPTGGVVHVEVLARYPDPPYGLESGNVFPPLKLTGYRNGGGPWTTIDVGQYHDPDGSRGINALVIDVEAAWCSVSRELARDLPRFHADTVGRGARFLSVLLEDQSGQPATRATADVWLAEFALPFDLAIDPEQQSMPPKADPHWGVPRTYVIDPRTMRIVRIHGGVNPDATSVPGLDAVLTSNGAPRPG